MSLYYWIPTGPPIIEYSFILQLAFDGYFLSFPSVTSEKHSEIQHFFFFAGEESNILEANYDAKIINVLGDRVSGKKRERERLGGRRENEQALLMVRTRYFALTKYMG